VPSFSVALPAYQVAGLIGVALASVFAQTVAAHEVIVVDDGSTDGLERAIEPWRDRIVFIQKENGGVASALNAGLAAATGDFLLLLGPDDRFDPERIEALGELAASRPDLDVLTTDAFLEVQGERFDRFYRGATRFAAAGQRRAILESNFVFGLVGLRRERVVAMGGFDEAIEATSDWDMLIRLLLDGSRAGVVDEPLATYSLRAGSLSSSRERFLRGRSATLRKTLARPDLSDDERAILQRQLDAHSATLLRLTAQDALLERRADTRSLAARVLVGSGQPLRSRAKAAFALVAPSLARPSVAATRRRAAADPRKLRAARE
jgi:glycosyltransferase involved in cell wall biosynthesis